jgi:hypothetical protein
VHPFKLMIKFHAMEPISFGDAWEIVERARRVLQVRASRRCGVP